MPIYEYECDQQGHRFEKWQSIQDEPLKTCPVCGSPIHKLFHPAGLIFKGSGWYVTDNRKSSGDGDKSGSSTSHSTGAKSSGDSKESTEKKDVSPEKGSSEKTSSEKSSSEKKA